jgi:two-component system, response regulator PdtaR
MRILIVEDEPLIAMCLEDALLHAGHQVVGIATDSREADRLAQTLHPAIALVDVDLSQRREGLRIARDLRSQGIAPVFVTGQVQLARENADFAVGVIGKPFEPNDVVDAIEVVDCQLRGGTPPPPAVPAAFELFPIHA